MAQARMQETMGAPSQRQPTMPACRDKGTLGRIRNAVERDDFRCFMKSLILDGNSCLFFPIFVLLKIDFFHAVYYDFSCSTRPCLSIAVGMWYLTLFTFVGYGVLKRDTSYCQGLLSFLGPHLLLVCFRDQ